jgi:SAM-dependent methyltransferase
VSELLAIVAAGAALSGALLIANLLRRRIREGDDARSWEERWSRPGFYEHTSWRLPGEELPPELREVVDSGWFPPGASVLDIGCGNGIIANLLAKAGYRVLGVDFAPSAIQQARRSYGTGPNPRFSVADITRDRIDETFDCLLDRGCFHTLPDSQRAAFVGAVTACSRSGSRLWLMSRDECAENLEGEFARAGFVLQRTTRATIRRGDRAHSVTIFWLVRDGIVDCREPERADVGR